MKRRKCGTHSLELPILGIGCWAYGGGSYWGEQSQRDVDNVVAAALDRGVDYFDTAEGYNDGRSEEALGRALGTRRSQAIIGSKIAPGNTEPETLRAHCEASLKRLGTDYLDLYMFHWPISKRSVRGGATDELPRFSEAIETMLALKREGKIRHIGLSNYGPKQLTEALDLSDQFVVNQLAYNMLSRAIELEIVPICQEHGLGIIGYSPLMQGILTGKYASIDEIPDSRTRTRHFRGDRPRSRHGGPGAEAETMKALSRVGAIASENGHSMGQLALAWSVNNPDITCTLVGARTVEQLEDNILGAELSLSETAMKRLNEATDALKEKLGQSPDYYSSMEESRTW